MIAIGEYLNFGNASFQKKENVAFYGATQNRSVAYFCGTVEVTFTV